MSIQFVVQGLVQGVGFRYFVYRQAVRLGLRGFVRNRPDGSVEVAAEGDEAALRDLEEALWRGPGSAVVHEVCRQPLPEAGRWSDFRIEV